MYLIPSANIDTLVTKAQLHILMDWMTKFTRALQKIRFTRENHPGTKALRRCPEDDKVKPLSANPLRTRKSILTMTMKHPPSLRNQNPL